jgi:hypothetical protein
MESMRNPWPNIPYGKRPVKVENIVNSNIWYLTIFSPKLRPLERLTRVLTELKFDHWIKLPRHPSRMSVLFSPIPQTWVSGSTSQRCDLYLSDMNPQLSLSSFGRRHKSRSVSLSLSCDRDSLSRSVSKSSNQPMLSTTNLPNA